MMASVLLALGSPALGHDDGEQRDTGEPIWVAVNAPASEVGRWAPPMPWPVMAIHAAVLPTGEVMHYSYPPERDGRPSLAEVWDSTTGQFRTESLDLEVDVYCSGMAFLADGRLHAAGGWAGEIGCTGAGIAATHVFDPFASTWTRLEDMRRPRYYPTSLELGDGSIMILSGYDADCQPNRDVEVFHPAGGIDYWPQAARQMHLYPRAFLLGSGKVADVGPDPVTWVLDPGPRTWSVVATTVLGLPRREGTAFRVPGRKNTLMLCGGHTNQHGDGAPTETCESMRFRSRGGGHWVPAAPMHFARAHLNSVLLPDGTVLVVGGGQEGKYTTPVLNPELYDPETGSWTILPRQQFGRMYHATAVLLPDGRVLSAGQDDDPADGQQSGTTGEIYKPAYLFRGGRPKILSGPEEVQYGEEFVVSTRRPRRIERVVLMGLATQTHSINPNQRYVLLDFELGAARELLVTAPSRPNRVPPGTYMLFVLNGRAVPSKAKLIRIG